MNWRTKKGRSIEVAANHITQKSKRGQEVDQKGEEKTKRIEKDFDWPGSEIWNLSKESPIWQSIVWNKVILLWSVAKEL